MVIMVCVSARVRTVHVEPDWFTMTARTMVRAPAPTYPASGCRTGAERVDTMTAGAALTAVHVESPDTAAVAPNQMATVATAMAPAIAAMEVACRRTRTCVTSVDWVAAAQTG